MDLNQTAPEESKCPVKRFFEHKKEEYEQAKSIIDDPNIEINFDIHHFQKKFDIAKKEHHECPFMKMFENHDKNSDKKESPFFEAPEDPEKIEP
jgi:hypothetical protein